ncbi:uncharacterized protein BDW43DRAFT_271484 [Aspergillus alliaceus]|uniref:uncharacterized protein n=1 Tax=Petromyces alliaceus TaxID=209559 RepID=UPI0012A3FA7E|nr:uncharacterized protein BDW43DRAFT_271484 [Aspergillus alliaceus]KAB8235282.1 hypothetical protein BDW43DRAFT_271484 [Aspergillus alliaceus]
MHLRFLPSLADSFSRLIMLFLDTGLLPYSPIESLLNPLLSIWNWLSLKNTSTSLHDEAAGYAIDEAASKEPITGLSCHHIDMESSSTTL